MIKLPKEAMTNVEQYRGLTHERNVLAALLTRFAENFEDCGDCEGSGITEDDTCRNCGGTGRQIQSYGLMLELEQEARIALSNHAK